MIWWKSGIRRYLATGEARMLKKTIEITALHKSGEEFYVSLTISTTINRGLISFTAFIRDIRHQKKNEMDLAKKTMELEKSNQELGNFAHVASHDLKEPIRKAMVFTDLLASEYGHLLPEQGKKYLSKLFDAYQRMNNMVEGVLNYSLANNQQGALEVIDLHAIIASIEADLEIVIKERNATILYNDLHRFQGFPFLIYQLFYNLINNSLKFSRPDIQPLIQIKSRLLKDPENLLNAGNLLEIIVTDNGIGFDQVYAKEIFNAFKRLHSVSEYQGTGLGLALCRNILEKHGGSIEAFGQQGHGATFKIILPYLPVSVE